MIVKNLDINSEIECEDYMYNSHSLYNIKHDGIEVGSIKFQKGSIKEVGNNGIFLKDILSIAIHQLEDFQGSEFNCEENQIAIEHIEKALISLNNRTNDRIKRNVNGKYIK